MNEIFEYHVRILLQQMGEKMIFRRNWCDTFCHIRFVKAENCKRVRPWRLGDNNFFQPVQFVEFAHGVVTVDLFFIDDTTTHRLFCDGTRVHFLFHSTHCNQSIYVALFGLTHTIDSEDALLCE